MDTIESKVISTNLDDEENERINFYSIIAAFKYYRTSSLTRVNDTENYLNVLPEWHQTMLSKYRDHLKQLKECIDVNYSVIKKLIKDIDTLFVNSPDTLINERDSRIRVKAKDIENVQITLKQFARDWSSDGKEERRQCYTPIIDAIVDFYNPDEVDVSQIKVLVPGAGLGRLTYELAYRGYYCEGNEFSLFMLIASNFILNRCSFANQYTLYPWIHQFVNNAKRADQVAAISFPDVSPMQSPPKGTFSMVAGDFLKVYNESNHWDCVATCFFIDCTNNVVEFIETIYDILKPGAVWVNLGPLLYHYSNVLNEGSIEPTYEDLVSVIKAVGFEMIKNETGLATKYSQNPRSMQQSEYLSVFFVCRKPLSETNGILIASEDHSV